jgi:hypothetical protein
MNYLVFNGVSGMTIPYNIWGCDYYGNNCILIATINNPVPPQITIALPPQFDDYPAILIKLSNCVNCDYSEFITCGLCSKQFQDGDCFYFMDDTLYDFQS